MSGPRLRPFDPDTGATLTWSIIDQGDNGTANANSGTTTTSAQNKTINYSPDLNYNGADSFIVRVTDNTALTDDMVPAEYRQSGFVDFLAPGTLALAVLSTVSKAKRTRMLWPSYAERSMDSVLWA